MANMGTGDFFEVDEDVDEVLAAYNEGQKRLTEEPTPWRIVSGPETFSGAETLRPTTYAVSALSAQHLVR